MIDIKRKKCEKTECMKQLNYDNLRTAIILYPPGDCVRDDRGKSLYHVIDLFFDGSKERSS